MGPTTVLEARAVCVDYRSGGTSNRAVDDVTFELHAGEILGIVGESGSGKSSLGRVVAGFQPPTSGEISVADRAVPAKHRTGHQDVQMIFQDAMTALDPRTAVWKSVAEAMARGRRIRPALRDPAVGLLREVGLSPAIADRRPRDLSGGQRQRVAIARALAAAPTVLVCDEAVSALDVSVRARILNLLVRLRAERQLAMVFISHDLSVVSQLADRVLVMHRGIVVEQGRTRDVIDRPSDEYTQRLLAAVPRIERRPFDLAG